MRVLFLRRKTRKIFVSKPYIKQTNDNNVFTVFIYNRDKQFIKRKLFFINKKFSLYKLWLLNHFYNKKKLFKSKNNYFFANINSRYNNLKSLKGRLWTIYRRLKLEKRRFNKKRFNNNKFNNKKFNSKKFYKSKFNKNKFYKRRFNKNKFHKRRFNKKIFDRKRCLLSGIKLKSELDFFRYRINNMDKNYDNIKNIMLYKFLLHVIYTVSTDNINNKLLLGKINKNKISLKQLNIVNKNLLYYISTNIIKNNILSLYDIKLMYVRFKNKYMKKTLMNLHSKHTLLIRCLSSLHLNNLKFTKLLHNLKIYLSKLYNKNTILNIISLKYPYLDGDIYTELVVNKAKKKLSFKKVLKRAIKLAKLPKFIDPYKKKKLNNYNYLENYSVLSLEKYNTKIKDSLNNILLNIFSNKFINKQLKAGSPRFILKKTNALLNTVKFKWISGVKIQGAGRLTRRFIASRAFFKRKLLGRFRNEQHEWKIDGLRKMPTVMLRNTEKANIQYNFNNSQRRIGAFGIKNTISVY